MAPPNLKVLAQLTKQNLSNPRHTIADLNYFGTLTFSKEASIQNWVDSISDNVDAASSPPCPLLDKLPQELRDMIWEQVVVEPKLCDKRHVPECAFHNRARTCQTPPIETQYQKRNPPECNSEEVQRCQRLCLRRKGLGLLGTNKQIHREASEVFWKKNTFCVRSDLAGFSSIVHCSLDLSRVQNLMLWNMDPETMLKPVEGWPDGANSLFYEVLERLPGLKRLEMQGEMLQDTEDAEAILRLLPSLKVIRLWQFQSVKLESTGDKFYLGIHQDFVRYRRDPSLNAPEGSLIAECQQRLDACSDGMLATNMRSTSWSWRDHREGFEALGRKSMAWAQATASRIEDKGLSQQSHGPLEMTVSTLGTNLAKSTAQAEHQVSIWGLPTHTQAWLEEEAKKIAEEEEKAAQAARERLNAWGTAKAYRKVELGKGRIDRQNASVWLNAGVTAAVPKCDRGRASKRPSAVVEKEIKAPKVVATKVEEVQEKEAPSEAVNGKKQPVATPRPKGRWYRKVSPEELASW